ncbi:hypothetical protein Tco_0492613 [Tanacetum coccineum]
MTTLVRVKKAYKEAYNVLKKKKIDGPESLNFGDFANVNHGDALRELEEFCMVRSMHNVMTFISQAWLKLFIYVLEFMSTVRFKDHVSKLDINDTLVFQLGGIRRHMTMRQFILAIGLYTTAKMEGDLFDAYHESCT